MMPARPCRCLQECAGATQPVSIPLAPNVPPQVGAVARQIDAIAVQISPRGVDVPLLLAPARIPSLCRPQVAVLHGLNLPTQSIAALRAFLPEPRPIAVDVGPVTLDVAQVPADVVGERRCRTAEHQEGSETADGCNSCHGGASLVDDLVDPNVHSSG